MLQDPTRVPNVEVDGNYFQLKKAYPGVNDKESLLRKLILSERGAFGILDDEELHMCYWGIKEDIEKLVEEKWIRVIERKEESSRSTQKRVFFPRNLDDRNVEFSLSELPENCHNHITELWRGLGEVKWDSVLLEGPEDLLCDQERELISQSKVKGQAREKARFDENGRQLQEGEILAGRKRRRPRL